MVLFCQHGSVLITAFIQYLNVVMLHCCQFELQCNCSLEIPALDMCSLTFHVQSGEVNTANVCGNAH